MQQILRKIKRVEPVINTKQSRVNLEATVLNEIKSEKVEIVQAMKAFQRKYMEGVEKLNSERESSSRNMLGSLESSLDYVKGKWYKLYRDVQEIERKERAQMSILLDAQLELKSVEKLRGKYEETLRQEIKISDQKVQDENAIRRFSNAE